eukprot:6031194-Amphidinium_carterae.1
MSINAAKLERDQRLKAVREKVTGLMIENELETGSASQVQGPRLTGWACSVNTSRPMFLPPRGLAFLRHTPRADCLLLCSLAVDCEQFASLVATIGGLIYEPTSLSPAAFFFAAVPPEFTDMWDSNAPVQPLWQNFCHCGQQESLGWEAGSAAERKTILGFDNVGTQMAM